MSFQYFIQGKYDLHVLFPHYKNTIVYHSMIKVQYSCTKCFSFVIIPLFLQIALEIASIWFCQVKFSSIMVPRNLFEFFTLMSSKDHAIGLLFLCIFREFILAWNQYFLKFLVMSFLMQYQSWYKNKTKRTQNNGIVCK